ncbi:MAG: protein chain elongation factor EF-Ts [Candidatus Westeberhardia cardiocondylae]|nr:protein chain elongation factor EF-Ts [Candidatus Westeberhardia cardiocondylae]
MLNNKKNINVEIIKKLRKKTGIGILTCKKALIQTKGKINEAIKYLRTTHMIKINENNIISNLQGTILAKISEKYQSGVLIELNCESDFTTQTKEFKNFGKKLIKFTLQNNINNIDILKIKFKKEHINIINKIKENIKIRRMQVLYGNTLGMYTHRNKIGVIVSAKNMSKKLIKQIAMHIAANKPKYIDTSNIPLNIINEEKKIQLNIASQLNKQYNISKKIVEGQMKKFINNISLLKQPFILNTNKNIEQLLLEKNAKINKFIRFELGENI